MSEQGQEGGCRCGQLRFTISGAPLVTMACHCTGCQRMTGSAFSLSSLYPGDRFTVTKGEPVRGGLREGPRHSFCPHCMSWVFTRFEGTDDFVNVRTTMLDAPPPAPPFIETFTSEMLPWAKTPAVHSFARFPPEEQFESLMADYAARPA